MQESPVILAVLNAVSTGTIINLIIMSLSQYYVCDPVFETPMMKGAMACDAIRYISFVMAIALSVPDGALRNISGDNISHAHKERIFSAIMCLICAIVLLASLIQWNDACSNCVQREEQGDDAFSAELGHMLHTQTQHPCEGSGGQSPWFNPQSWCRSAVSMHCAPAFATTNVQKIRSVQSCVRWGCTDFLPESQYAYFFEVIGDVSRIVLFYLLSLEHNDATTSEALSEQQATVNADDLVIQSQGGLRKRGFGRGAIKF